MEYDRLADVEKILTLWYKKQAFFEKSLIKTGQGICHRRQISFVNFAVGGSFPVIRSIFFSLIPKRTFLSWIA